MAQSENNPTNKTIESELLEVNKIELFISELGDKNKNRCRSAYDSLLLIGKPAVKPLVEALNNPVERIRWLALKLLEELKVDWTPYVGEKTITALLKDLDSQNGFERLRVRRALTNTGSRSVEPLLEVFKKEKGLKRWESAKALSQIGDPQATNMFIEGLYDVDFDIRWLSAEGLISIGEPVISPLLRELISKPDSQWLREGAHHVLHDLNNEKLKTALIPVLKSLEHEEAYLEVPLAARSALNYLK